MNKIENFSKVFEIYTKNEEKAHEEIVFHNSIQNCIFTTIYWLQQSLVRPSKIPTKTL